LGGRDLSRADFEAADPHFADAFPFEEIVAASGTVVLAAEDQNGGKTEFLVYGSSAPAAGAAAEEKLPWDLPAPPPDNFDGEESSSAWKTPWLPR
jgi:hypothetical protein